MFKHIAFRIIVALVLLVAITCIAFFAFNTGMMRGAALNLPVPATLGQPVPYYGYGMLPFIHPFPFFGFGFFGLLAPSFLLFLVFGAFRRMMWGPRFGWHHRVRSAWGEKGPGIDGFVPPMFAEWHRRSHSGVEQDAEPAVQK